MYVAVMGLKGADGPRGSSGHGHNAKITFNFFPSVLCFTLVASYGRVFLPGSSTPDLARFLDTVAAELDQPFINYA